MLESHFNKIVVVIVGLQLTKEGSDTGVPVKFANFLRTITLTNM